MLHPSRRRVKQSAAQLDRHDLVGRAVALEHRALIFLDAADRVVAVGHHQPHGQPRIQKRCRIGHFGKRVLEHQCPGTLLGGHRHGDAAADRAAHHYDVLGIHSFAICQPALGRHAVRTQPRSYGFAAAAAVAAIIVNEHGGRQMRLQPEHKVRLVGHVLAVAVAIHDEPAGVRVRHVPAMQLGVVCRTEPNVLRPQPARPPIAPFARWPGVHQ